jgi:hypothetical protein
MRKKFIYRTFSLVLILTLLVLWQPVVSLAEVGNIGSEKDLRDAVSGSGSGDVILSSNIGLRSELVIARSLTLDLNGHTL